MFNRTVASNFRLRDPDLNFNEGDKLSFDGGETGCGELLLDLLIFMKARSEGDLVSVRALDPGAPLEIPAWCRLTNHTLVSAEHPIYQIQKPINDGN